MSSSRWAPLWLIVVMTTTFAVVIAIAWLATDGGQGPPSDDATPPGALPVLSVADVLNAGDELPVATATVVGRLDVVVPLGDGAPPVLVLSRDDGDGELLVVPEGDTPIPPAILRAGPGARVRAIGQLQIATVTNPPPGGGKLRASSLGEPLLKATSIALAQSAKQSARVKRRAGSRSSAQ